MEEEERNLHEKSFVTVDNDSPDVTTLHSGVFKDSGHTSPPKTN